MASEELIFDDAGISYLFYASHRADISRSENYAIAQLVEVSVLSGPDREA